MGRNPDHLDVAMHLQGSAEPCPKICMAGSGGDAASESAAALPAAALATTTQPASPVASPAQPAAALASSALASSALAAACAAGPEPLSGAMPPPLPSLLYPWGLRPTLRMGRTNRR